MGADPTNLPDELGPDRFHSHCKRVAAWTLELAQARGLKADEQDALERAALSHHSLMSSLNGSGRASLLADLGVQEADPGPRPASATPDVGHEILEIANALDEHFEWEPFSDLSEDDTNPAASAALACLRCVKDSDLHHALTKLPVFPAVAQKVLDLLTRDDWNGYDLRVVAGSDQVLATEMIRAANSWAFAPRQPIKSLSHAITYIGADKASKILLGASIKPLFGTAALREIWNHAIDASEAAQGLAKLSKHVNPEEAFLAGLVHDIGRLAMALLPAEFQRRSARLLQRGCELSLVETVLAGVTHADLGGRALQLWNFPANLVEGVRFHHKPEQTDSRLAAILYLAERWTNPWEDLPSIARIKVALDRLGLQSETLNERDMHLESSMTSLRFSA